jgi:hypothetical protein
MHCTSDGSGDVHFQLIIDYFTTAKEKRFFACGKKSEGLRKNRLQPRAGIPIVRRSVFYPALFHSKRH